MHYEGQVANSETFGKGKSWEMADFESFRGKVARRRKELPRRLEKTIGYSFNGGEASQKASPFLPVRPFQKGRKRGNHSNQNASSEYLTAYLQVEKADGW